MRTDTTALAASEERYQAFIRNSNEGIWRVELEQPISINLPPAKQIKLMYKYAYLAEANDAMAKMYGLKKAKELVGMRLGDLLYEDDPENTAYLTAFIQHDYNLSGVESHERDPQGNEKYFRNSLIGIVKDGQVWRAWGTQQDVTEQRNATEALRKSEERLALALEASNMGTWEWNVVTGELDWSDELKRIYGLKPKDTITYEKYLSLIHPNDRAAMQRLIKAALKRKESYKVEHRVCWPNGEVHWALGQGRAFFDESGKPVRMIGTSMLIDRRKTAEEQALMMSRQNAELLELNTAKDEFISLASHQLRTPATGVKQYIGMLLEGYSDELTPDQLELLKTAYESNERQLKIVNDLLKVAHVDAERVILRKQAVDIGRLVQAVIDEQYSEIESRKQTIKVSKPRPLVLIDVDKDRLRMVLENLLDNASKYSPEGKELRIKIAQTKQEVTISISDQGVGIARKDQGKLFQKFSRINNELSTEVGGTGLGLYWAKKIIDLHGGTIVVTSKPRTGSTFTIKLPKSG